MKKLSGFRIAIGAGLVLIVVGIGPWAYWRWWSNVHNLRPLSMPLPLKPGEYTSPVFTTDLDDGYQIEIYFLPQDRDPLDLDWRIVNETGVVLQNGHYQDPPIRSNAGIRVAGNVAILERNYWPKPGVRQRAVVTIHQGSEAAAGPQVDTKLYIGLPSREDFGYGELIVRFWAAVVAGSGAVLLLVLLAIRLFRRTTSGNSFAAMKLS